MEQTLVDVGGKILKIDNDILDKIKPFVKITTQMDPETLFIDMDHQIFNYVVHTIKHKIPTKFHHKRYNNTLVRFGLLDEKFIVPPKITIIGNDIDSNDTIIKIQVDNKIFKTYKSTLSNCSLLNNLDLLEIKIDNINYKLFKYILNLLRMGESYYLPSDYIQHIDNFGINYKFKQDTQPPEQTQEQYPEHPQEQYPEQPQEQYQEQYPEQPQEQYQEQYQKQHNNYNIILDTYTRNKTDILSGLLQITSNDSKLYHHKDILNKYYAYSNRLINQIDKVFSHSSSEQYFNILPTAKPIDFGKTVIFEIPSKNYGDMIDDIILVFDLSPLSDGLWVNHLGNAMIKKLYINLNGQTIINMTGEYLDIQNKLIGKNYNSMNFEYDSYEEGINMSRQSNRIMVPITLGDKFPIIKNNINILLYVELHDKNKCIIGNINNENNIINMSVMLNYINLSMERPKLIKSENLYIFNDIKLISTDINYTDGPICETIVPLNNFDYIRDMCIVIHDNDNINFNYADVLLEAELTIGGKTFFKLDKMMLNKYLPIKYYNKVPDSDGIYYYSFSTNPSINKLFGGYDVHFKEDYPTNLIIKTNNIKGTINVYSSNYVIMSI